MFAFIGLFHSFFKIVWKNHLTLWFVESAKKTVGVSAVKKNTNAKAQAVQRESIFVLPFHLYF